MPEIVQRYDSITYDGTNSGDVLEFFETVSPADLWSIHSESEGVLTLKYEHQGDWPWPSPPPVNYVEIPESTFWTRSTGALGEAQIQGPWPPSMLAIGRATVPTEAEFAALVARVEALENGS